MSGTPDHAVSHEAPSELGEELWDDLFDLGRLDSESPARSDVGTFGVLKEYLQRIRIRRDKATKRARRRSTMPLVLRGTRRCRTARGPARRGAAKDAPLHRGKAEPGAGDR
jgi:hypothetical protein